MLIPSSIVVPEKSPSSGKKPYLLKRVALDRLNACYTKGNSCALDEAIALGLGFKSRAALLSSAKGAEWLSVDYIRAPESRQYMLDHGGGEMFPSFLYDALRHALRDSSTRYEELGQKYPEIGEFGYVTQEQRLLNKEKGFFHLGVKQAEGWLLRSIPQQPIAERYNSWDLQKFAEEDKYGWQGRERVTPGALIVAAKMLGIPEQQQGQDLQAKFGLHYIPHRRNEQMLISIKGNERTVILHEDLASDFYWQAWQTLVMLIKGKIINQAELKNYKEVLSSYVQASNSDETKKEEIINEITWLPDILPTQTGIKLVTQEYRFVLDIPWIEAKLPTELKWINFAKTKLSSQKTPQKVLNEHEIYAEQLQHEAFQMERTLKKIISFS